MKKTWIEGVAPGDVERIRQDFRAAAPARARLASMLQKKMDAYRRASTSKNAYDNPNWALMQADGIGYLRGMQEIIGLLQE